MLLNFSVSDSHIIRSLTHDLLIVLIHHWKQSNIEITANFDWDISNSIPSSHMHDVIVHSLFELAVYFSSARKQKLLSESKVKLQSPVDNKLKNFYFPVSEMLMTIYLHAFPTCTNEIDSEKEMTTETNDDTYDIETKVILLSFSTFKECIKYLYGIISNPRVSALIFFSELCLR